MPKGRPAQASAAERPTTLERLGIVSYANVAPLHYRLSPWPGAQFVRGVPTELNRRLMAGEIELTLISSFEFLQHRHALRALPDFSIATLGPVYSVMLFHWHPWQELGGKRVAVSSDSSTSVALLKLLLRERGIEAELVSAKPDLDDMLLHYDAALLIGDSALQEAVARRELTGAGRQGTPFVSDLGEMWYRLTRLPFTFAVWASRKDAPPSRLLVAKLRAAREQGLGHLAQVAAQEAARLELAPHVVQHYLANFRYYLAPPDRDGLLAFAERALPELRAGELEFWDL